MTYKPTTIFNICNIRRLKNKKDVAHSQKRQRHTWEEATRIESRFFIIMHKMVRQIKAIQPSVMYKMLKSTKQLLSNQVINQAKNRAKKKMTKTKFRPP